MPDLTFHVVSAEAVSEGIVPMVRFAVEIDNESGDRIQSIILEAQIRIEPTQRSYNEHESERLFELFGEPERWGRTLRSLPWTRVGVTVPAFEKRTRTGLSVPVSYDLNIAATKYFYGLEGGDIPLLFLFSGTVFYTDASGRLLMQRISWEQESSYRLPVRRWRQVMEHHFPKTAWLYLGRDVFDELYAYRRRGRHPSWDAAVSCLLEAAREGAAA